MSENYRKSEDIFEKFENYVPCGNNSPIRAFKAAGVVPPVVKKALGSKIEDVDGNTYIDYVGSWGAMILGHSKLEVIETVKSTVENGLSFGASTELEYKLTRLISKAVPTIDVLRIYSSRTEAAINAIRLARRFTGKNIIIKFTCSYHGNFDEMLVDSNLVSTNINNINNINGVQKSYENFVKTGDYNNFENIINIFNDNKDNIAAIIVEPIATNMGIIPPKQGFLELLKILSQKQDVLLIFDEITTGFRVKYECAQGQYNIKPDLTIFGKIVGGGMPIGVLGGRREIMAGLSPVSNVYQSEALAANPVILASGVRTLEILKSDLNIYKRIERKAGILEKSIIDIARKYGVKLKINRIGSMLTTFFTDLPVVDYETLIKADNKKYFEHYRSMLNMGVFIAPTQYESMFVSDAHTDDDIEKTIKAFETSLKGMRTK